jgi:16S rRNA (uracil1498-N3)-methyltransferase
LPKGDRAQFLVEKLTEIGVKKLIPLQTERSIIHPREGKLEKLKRYVIEASKQCGRNVLMEVDPLVPWDSYCSHHDLPAIRFLAHPVSDHRLEKPLVNDSGVALAVGPEGGFTEEEIARATASGWQLKSLGPTVLRIETAAIVMAAWVVQMAN